MILRQRTFRILLCVTLVLITANSLFFVLNGYGTTEEIDSKFGDSPVIDGSLDLLSGEWNKATKQELLLEDLPIEFWVMQNDNNLYISIQLELEIGYHNITEFIGLIISNSSSENNEDFIDAKFLQFSNISNSQSNYLDYYINNSVFSVDSEINGDGVAKLEGITSIYEFSIPIENTTDINEDVSLDHGTTYAFNITYGESPSYPKGIKKSAVVLINLKALPSSLPPFSTVFIFIICLIIFGIIGILYVFYIYKIFKLKGKIQRIKR
jgi:hypothetical protein